MFAIVTGTNGRLGRKKVFAEQMAVEKIAQIAVVNVDALIGRHCEGAGTVSAVSLNVGTVAVAVAVVDAADRETRSTGS